MEDHFQRVAEAFSYKAEQYDEFGVGHVNLERMRRRVYAHVLRFLRPADRILELNAGTGTDAVYFASQGYGIHAIDISPGMLASIADKVSRYNLEGRLYLYQSCSFTDLSGVTHAPFQYVYSNFGGLNCIADLAGVAGQVARVLVPGGRLTWVIMPPICPWDLALAFTGHFRQAFRRLQPGGTLASVEGVRFEVHYFTPHQVRQALGDDFRVLRLEGLSVFTPTADRKNFALRYPRLYRMLARADDAFSPLFPFNHWGDFFILTAEYCPR